MVTTPPALARRIARVHRAFLGAFAAAFPGRPYRPNRALDVAVLIHHVEADCCGRVEWAAEVASAMVEEAAGKPASFADLWLRERLAGLAPSAARRVRRELLAEVQASALHHTRRAAAVSRRVA